MREILTYAEALARWITAGRPVRSDAEVVDIHRFLCRPCPFYHRDKCRECGCRVRLDGPAVLNKIKMATEHCPKGKW